MAGDQFPPDTNDLRNWMFHNPHGMNLGRLRLCWSNGQEIAPDEVSHLSAQLDLWSGEFSSTFDLGGQPVRVRTCVHPTLDAMAVRIVSPLLAEGKLEVALDFPYPALKNSVWAGDFTRDDPLMTTLTHPSTDTADFLRRVDTTTYYARLAWSAGSRFQEQRDQATARHFYALDVPGRDTLEVSCAYSAQTIDAPLSSYEETAKASAAHWENYWRSGGAIDLSASKDPRWHELERRIVLSQYHVAAQSSGTFPPAEDGLMGIDQWGNRFHMEMIWWHLAHYALWDRWPMAEKALGVYGRFLASSRQRAQQLGLKGAVWPKGVGPDGISQPWEGNLVLLWKQPHPIFFAELDYRLHPTHATLDRWAEIVRQTAEYMADYATLNPQTHLYALVPDMPPSEQAITVNTPFDLAYWRWGLEAAQRWRERLGQPREPHWEEVRLHLAPLPAENGVFTLSPQWHDTYTTRNISHPDPVGVFGMLPAVEGVDAEVARRTVLKVWQGWNWSQTWGWDYPWLAMAAARVGEPQIAIDALLKDTAMNRYDWRGINTGGPCPYLPGNGGLLYAVALMAAGWDGAPDHAAPGFPKDGSWTVRWEGLESAP